MWQIGLLLGCLSVALAETKASTGVDPSTLAKIRVYVGTYTNGKGQGIVLLDLDPESGTLTARGLAAESLSPSFLAIDPTRRNLYSVNEVAESGGRKSGGVSAFAIDPKDGTLKHLNTESSEGAGPCHLVVDHAGKNVLVANYGGGTVASLPILADGRLGAATASIEHKGTVADPKRQGKPHAHSINVDAANRFAIAADLGLDKLLVYKFDAAKGTLTPNDPPFTSTARRSGPRHFAFHPDGRHAYVINEINCTVTALDYDAEHGVLKELQTLPTLPAGVEVKPSDSTAEVQVHPSGKFLYGSNRGNDSIAIFAIDAATGRLTPVGHQPTQGKTPRNFAIDPTGRFLLAANQDSGTIVVFRIDSATGKLEPTGQSIEVKSPVCLKFIPIAK
ncbi:lactonase family protein [Singulisphaera sp. Ch08]|uniref:Lactonase family protein n=1 Tax=Singulisphaera sp. Ch08 TaxID=3120278 RepID=A0AAU7C8I9_9BACT